MLSQRHSPLFLWLLMYAEGSRDGIVVALISIGFSKRMRTGSFGATIGIITVLTYALADREARTGGFPRSSTAAAPGVNGSSPPEGAFWETSRGAQAKRQTNAAASFDARMTGLAWD